MLPNIAGANVNNLFRSVAAPWVEFQIFTANPALIKPDVTIGRPRTAGSLSLKHFNPRTAGDIVMLYANRYKKSFMVFRWVACALLHASGIRETRPSPSYRQPACVALAQAIKNHFVVITPGVDTGLRNPLRLLVEAVYENARACRDDEAALLFMMLVEAMGIPCRFVIVSDEQVGWRSYVECQLDLERDWMAFDFLSDSWGVVPDSKHQPHIFTADGGPSTRGRATDFIDDTVRGRFAVPERLIGSYDLSKSTFWREPKIRPSWFSAVDRALQNLPRNFNDAFLVNKYFDHTDVNVAENFGPDVTGAVIAKAANMYSTGYRNIFRTIVRDAASAFNVPNIETLPPKKQAQLIADLVRSIFPYAEETVGVEEITIPLRMFWFYCFFPGVQKFDCDDLALAFMTLAEAMDLKTAVRLAGDAEKGDEDHGDKYHVYPVLIENPLAIEQAYTYDVSSPTPWGVEMNRGRNYRDYMPWNPTSYEPMLQKFIGQGHRMAAGKPVAGRLPIRNVKPPRHIQTKGWLFNKKMW